MVTQSILKIYEGNIAWNSDTKPDIEIFLKSVIKTQINHICTSKEYRKTCRSSEENEVMESMCDPDSPEIHASLALSIHDPEMAILEKEKADEYIAFENEILKRVEGDPELETVVLYILDDVTTPREIAEKMGISVERIYNIKKRLRRIFLDVVNKKMKTEVK